MTTTGQATATNGRGRIHPAPPPLATLTDLTPDRGRAVAKAKGVRFGRPPALSTEQIAHARQLINDDMKPAEVARLLGVHRATLYRALDGAPTES